MSRTLTPSGLPVTPLPAVLPPPDPARLGVHTITTRPWSLAQALGPYAAAGVKHVTVWKDALAGWTPQRARAAIRDAGLATAAYCRGGFFPARDEAGRRAAIDDNLRLIDEAADLGAPLLVLVCGAVPGLPLPEARRQITGGIAALLPHASASGVKLGIEPLHPMYADDRSAINTVAQALAICDELRSSWVGVVVDVYHVWWDLDLDAQIARAGRDNRLFAFHACDWRTPTTDLLQDRGLPGEGCIPVRRIRAGMDRAGFAGPIEIEVFSRRHWERDQHELLRDLVTAYHAHA
jgi:sugar phosphate isomerase/epimerase